MKYKILAIVLTYWPDLMVVQRSVAALCPQVEKILIVDNGTRWDAAALCTRLTAADQSRIEFLWLEKNLGVGAGHNRGIRWARAHGFSHVLILDHDSVPGRDMVRHLCLAEDRLTREGVRVAAVGPRYVDRYTGSVSGFVRLGPWRLRRVRCDCGQDGQTLETDFLISSGALISIATLDEVGEMNEGLFIDHVDTEWMFRARALGFRSFGACDAIMEHSLGTATMRFWFGHWRTVPMHSPERHYYVVRNGVLLLRTLHRPPHWLQNGIVRLFYVMGVFLAFAPHRRRRMRLMLRGLWHGLRGVTGPMP